MVDGFRSDTNKQEGVGWDSSLKPGQSRLCRNQIERNGYRFTILISNAEVEDLKTQSRNNQQSIVSLKERLLYQEVYDRRENLRFFGLPESTESTIEDSREVLYRFLERDLDIEGSRNIEFQGVHRLGRKKEGTSRPIIARFLRYPDREQVFKAALEAQDEIDVKLYADLPKEIQENRKKQ